jgi:hypothetical protein
MCRNICLAAVVSWLLACFVPGANAEAPAMPDTNQDEQLLRGAGVTPDGPGLLAFFRKRVPTEEDRQRAEELVGKLGSRTFRDRQKASTELVKLGLAARPALARAAKHRDVEVARRAKECLDIIDRASSIDTEAAAVRVLKARRPDGACRALIDYLPSVRDGGVEEEVLAALLVLGVRGGKADDALARALEDKEPSRRAAAALVLGHSGPDALKDKVRRLLKSEADAKVRLRGAQGLLVARDKRAVPVLLTLLSDAPVEIARDAHEMLGWLAGDKGPGDSLGDDAEGRKKSRASWDGWWKANEAKFDLAKAEVDLPWLSGNQRARAVTMQFINSMLKGDAELLKKSTDVPFCMVGVMTLNTRQEFDQLLGQAIAQAPKQPKVEFGPPRLVSLNVYLKSPSGEKMKEFIGKHPQGEIRIVYLSGKMAGQAREETAALIVRVRGGRAHVIGIGEVRETPRP